MLNVHELIEMIDLIDKNIRTIDARGETIPTDLVVLHATLKDSLIKALRDKLAA